MGKSIRPKIKKTVYMSNHNQILTDIVKKLEVTDDLKKTDTILLWNDVVGVYESLAKMGKMMGKRVITVQHGRRAGSRYFKPFHKEIISDKLCVWGERDKQRLVDAGHPSEKIVVTGSPILQCIKPRKKHEGINVVFSPEHWDHDVDENTEVAEVLAKMKGINLVTKIIIGHDAKKYINTVYSDRNAEGHLAKCVEVLQTADIVVCISESTFELIAEAMDIPVVIADIWRPKPCNGDDRYLVYQRPISEACARSSLESLEATIRLHLKNPDLLKKERKFVVEQEGGISIKDPVKKIIEVICTT